MPGVNPLKVDRTKDRYGGNNKAITTKIDPEVIVRINPPRGLDKATKVAFNMYAEIMFQDGSSRWADGNIILDLAYAHVEVDVLRRLVDEHGRAYSIETEAGNIIWRDHPYVKQLQEARRNKRQLMIECGLTPSRRRSVMRAPPVKENPFAKFRRTTDEGES